MILTCREMQRVKVYWRCWSDWGSSLSAIHMSLGRVSPHVRLTSALKSAGVVRWREIWWIDFITWRRESVRIIGGSILLPSVQLWLTCAVQHCGLNVYILFGGLTTCEISIQNIHNSTIGLRRTKHTVINVALKEVYSLGLTKHYWRRWTREAKDEDVQRDKYLSYQKLIRRSSCRRPLKMRCQRRRSATTSIGSSLW